MLSPFSRVRLFATPWTVARQAPQSRDSPGKNTRVDYHAFLQGFFPIYELNLCLLNLLHWQAGSLPPVPLGSPIIPEEDTEIHWKFFEERNNV